jgi:hypothetical protein
MKAAQVQSRSRSPPPPMRCVRERRSTRTVAPPAIRIQVKERPISFRVWPAALVQSDDPTTLERVVLHETRVVSTSGPPTAPAMPAFDWRLGAGGSCSDLHPEQLGECCWIGLGKRRGKPARLAYQIALRSKHNPMIINETRASLLTKKRTWQAFIPHDEVLPLQDESPFHRARLNAKYRTA